MSATLQEIIMLLTTAIITLCTEIIGFVHSVALNTALAKHSRFEFNANLRLITWVKGKRKPKFNPDGLFINIVYCVSLVLTYAAPGRLFSTTITDKNHTDLIIVSPVAIWFIGFGLVIQGSLALVVLACVRKELLEFGNTSLEATRCLVDAGAVQRREGRCMLSLLDASSDSQPVVPRRRQPRLWSCSRSACYIVIGTLVVPVLTAVIPLCVYKFANADITSGPCWGLGESTCYRAILFSYAGVSPTSDPVGYGIPEVALILSAAAIQAPYTLWLHACELITILSRDESASRNARTKGARITFHPIMGPLITVITSSESVFLLVFKTGIHWLFGNMFLTSTNTVRVAFPPALYFNVGLFVPAVFIVYLGLRRRSGPQPVTFGHLQTICDLVDEWYLVGRFRQDRRLFWGDKGEGSNGVQRFTAAGRPHE